MEEVFASLMKTLLAMGPPGLVAGVFAFLWWDERKERRDAQKDQIAMGREALKAENDMTRALELLSAKVGAK